MHVKRAREVMYWPGMSRDIEDTITRCSECSEWRRNNQKEPLIPHEVSGRPWQNLGADIFQFRGKNFLCVVDYFSKFPEISLLSSKTSSSVVLNLKSIFARHGVPDELVADNMPFANRQLQHFALSWERTIGTIKELLRKAKDPYVALMEYRNTPVTGIGLSPSQMLNSRRLKSKLPTTAELL